MSDGDRYFEMAQGDGPAPDRQGWYVDMGGGLAPVEFVPGLTFRPVVGERLMVNFVNYEPRTVAPLHAHAEEQVTFVIDGEFEFDLDGDVRLMRRGMAVVVPPFVPHGARTLGRTCFEVDVFGPPRQAMLDLIAAQAQAREDGSAEEG